MQHNTQVPVGKHNNRQHASPHHEVATDVNQMPIRPIIIISILCSHLTTNFHENGNVTLTKLPSLVAQEVVKLITYRATIDNKLVGVTLFCFRIILWIFSYKCLVVSFAYTSSVDKFKHWTLGVYGYLDADMNVRFQYCKMGISRFDCL